MPKCHARSTARPGLSACAALVWAVVASPGGWAQSVPPSSAVAQALPQPLVPGTIEREFQPPPQPRARPPMIQLPHAQQRAPADADSIRFGVKRVEVEGVQALPSDAIRALVAPLEGRDVSLAELIGVANRLTATYRNEGFILAQVVVPEQRLEAQDATVRLRAIEGFIDAVRFNGDVDAHAPRLDAIAEAIRGARPVTAAVLERYLLLLNDIPGLRAATTLTPSPTMAGAADLEIQINRSAVAGEVSIDNRGSRAVGSWRASADVEVMGLTGASRTALKIVSSGDRRLLFGNLQHEQGLGIEGTRLVVSAGAAFSRPTLAASLGVLAPEIESRTLAVFIHHPLIRSRAENLALRAGLTGYDGVSLASGARISEERIRALRAGFTWDRADALQGLNVVDVEFSRGLRAMGASSFDDPGKSRASGRPDFAKATLYAARLQSVARRWSVLVAATAQHAFTDLLSPELFGVGGEQFGRGYSAS
jgi:hemolysin activation/secretion protein